MRESPPIKVFPQAFQGTAREVGVAIWLLVVVFPFRFLLLALGMITG
ncbi:MAG: hypothetical protein WBA10_08175 [Elainellaceae cyanobacterium]